MGLTFHGIDGVGYDFSGYTLIMPSVSVGNVGQLACDLLISSMKLRKVGYIWSRHVLPVIGSDPFTPDSNSLTMSVEVFADAERKLAVLQQRAPVVTGMQDEYAEQLIEWITDTKISEVVMLSSCHAYERRDDDLTGSSLRFLISKESTGLEDTLINTCGAKELATRKDENGEDTYVMPGGGHAKVFYKKSTSCNTFTTVLLMAFCSEGNNIPEAVTVANAVNSCKKLMQQSSSTAWIYPASWKLMFGNREPVSIF